MPELSELTVKTSQCSPNTLNRASFRYIDISSVDRLTKQIVEVQPISVKEAPSRARKSVRINDVLVSTVRPNLNAVARVPVQYNNEIASTGFCVLRANPKLLDATYLFYFVQTEHFVNRLTELSTGAGYPAVSDSDILDTELNLPPLPEQQRLAALLDKADHLRRTRRYAQQLSDTFLQSVFLEMFGDPATNPKGWDIEALRSLSTKFSDGPFGSDLKSEHYSEQGVRVIRLQNVGIGEFVDRDKAFVSKTYFTKLANHRCLPGDVIAGTMGEPNLRAFIIPTTLVEALNKADCVQIRPDLSEATAEYLCWLLNMPTTLNLAAGAVLGQTRSRISMGRLSEFPVPVPPLPLQEQFAQVVQRTERLRGQQREAARQAEHLFQTLLAQAFRGEV